MNNLERDLWLSKYLEEKLRVIEKDKSDKPFINEERQFFKAYNLLYKDNTRKANYYAVEYKNLVNTLAEKELKKNLGEALNESLRGFKKEFKNNFLKNE